MSFVESNLLEGERVVYRAKLHWCMFVRPIIFFLIALVLYFNMSRLMYSFGGYWLYSAVRFINPIRIAILFIAVIYFAFVIVNYATTEIFITNKRISRKKGIIGRFSLDIKLDMVEAVMLSQRIIGRIFNYGHIYFTGVGAIAQKFHGIHNPLELRNVIITQIHRKESPEAFPEQNGF